MMLKDIPNGTTAKWIQLVASALVFPLLIWIMIELATIKGNRFTASEGKEVWREIAMIHAEIAALPPDNFERKVDILIERVSSLDKRLAVIEERVR